eukprot:GHVU01098963.1.p1 GENE.GHVU01098963.1~~GHVU01098963.1.p1  ORF type:complete len:361 (+),score=37.18 GHVU01098963.1:286-1368(+)
MRSVCIFVVLLLCSLSTVSNGLRLNLSGKRSKRRGRSSNLFSSGSEYGEYDDDLDLIDVGDEDDVWRIPDDVFVLLVDGANTTAGPAMAGICQRKFLENADIRGLIRVKSRGLNVPHWPKNKYNMKLRLLARTSYGIIYNGIAEKLAAHTVTQADKIIVFSPVDRRKLLQFLTLNGLSRFADKIVYFGTLVAQWYGSNRQLTETDFAQWAEGRPGTFLEAANKACEALVAHYAELIRGYETEDQMEKKREERRRYRQRLAQRKREQREKEATRKEMEELNRERQRRDREWERIARARREQLDRLRRSSRSESVGTRTIGTNTGTADIATQTDEETRDIGTQVNFDGPRDFGTQTDSRVSV